MEFMPEIVKKANGTEMNISSAHRDFNFNSDLRHYG